MDKKTIKLVFISQPVERTAIDGETKEERKYLQIVCEDENGVEYKINVPKVTEKLRKELENKEVTYKEIEDTTNTFKGKKYTFKKIILPKSSLLESF